MDLVATLPSARVERIKRYGYLIFLGIPALPFIGVALGQATGYPNVSAFFTVAYVFGLIPVLDALIGRDPHNPSPDDERTLGTDRYYRVLTIVCVPLMIVTLGATAYLAANLAGLNWLGWLGMAISTGLVGGALAINVAHELIHKDSRLERTCGGLLLALVCYGGFKVEHVRGHHVHVSTPRDASSASFGQSLYHFLPRAIVLNTVNAWRLEAARLRNLGRPVISRHNELLIWSSLSVAIAAGFYIWLGAAGLAFFLIQSLIAVTLLETVNYIEHYGLRRRLRSDGRYERTTHLHSWNSNFLLTNLLLFQLQRHSDHHAYPKRRYQVLRHFDDSPQLPAGYAAMFVLAWIPPLWRRVMDPRVRAYYRDEPERLGA